MLIVLHCDYCREESGLNVAMELEDQSMSKGDSGFRMKRAKRLLFCDMACAEQWLRSDAASYP